MSPHLTLLRRTKFISQFFLNMLNLVTMRMIKLIFSPSHILSPTTITDEPCNYFVKPCFHPTKFQSRIREKMFKPLRLSSHLQPYPLNFVEYFPWFTREDHVTAEKHLGSFENFVDNFEIVHEDVTMRLFSKSLVRDVSLWFKGLEVD
jgi:hypothetical protein